MRNKVFASVVVYLHNDEKVAIPFLKNLSALLDDHFEYYEIICVDDCSTDNTLATLLDNVNQINDGGVFNIIKLTRRHGIESAMLAGSDKSVGDYIFEIESPRIDFFLHFLLDLFHKAQSGFDVVMAYRSKSPLSSRLFYRFLDAVSYVDMDLATIPALVVTRRALNSVLNIKERVRYRKALLNFVGYSKTKLEYEPIQELQNRERSLSEKLGLAIEMTVSFSKIGSKLPLALSCIFLLFTIFAAGFAFYSYFFDPQLSRGWTSLMTFLSFSFFGLFAVLGVLGEYISRILIELQGRPTYTIEQQHHCLSESKEGWANRSPDSTEESLTTSMRST